jgi:hypothetical protein
LPTKTDGASHDGSIRYYSGTRTAKIQWDE